MSRAFRQDFACTEEYLVGCLYEVQYRDSPSPNFLELWYKSIELIILQAIDISHNSMIEPYFTFDTRLRQGDSR